MRQGGVLLVFYSPCPKPTVAGWSRALLEGAARNRTTRPEKQAD